ncbi:hypothetical protein NL676_024346 [Syzygium grande]|nr:hypothetical protein NL676_024346 [Syzygium grande]
MVLSTVAAQSDTQETILNWVISDLCRFLSAVIRVGDLIRTLNDDPERKYSKAVLGYGSQKSHSVLELIQRTFSGGAAVLAFQFEEDFGSYSSKLLQGEQTPKPLCQVMRDMTYPDHTVCFDETVRVHYQSSQ